MERLHLRREQNTVCSASIRDDGPHPLRRPEDLRHHNLLHSIPMPDDWRDWLRAAGQTNINSAHGLRFESTALAIQAVVSGLGVALSPISLVTDDLAAVRLVEPFNLTMASNWAYYFVVSAPLLQQPKIQAFRNWLLAEAGSERFGNVTSQPSS